MSARPLICQMQVSPGLTARRRRSAWLYLATSRGTGGRGPTRDISPMSTLKNWGNSSIENLRSQLPHRHIQAKPEPPWRGLRKSIASQQLIDLHLTHKLHDFISLPPPGPRESGAKRALVATVRAFRGCKLFPDKRDGLNPSVSP